MKKSHVVTYLLYAITLSGLVGLTACQSNESENAPSGNSSGTGKLSLRLTDAPVDGADAVYVTVSGVLLHSSEHGRLEFPLDPPQQVELLSLSKGGTVTLLDGKDVPAGRYQWMRLMVVTENEMDTYLKKDGAIHELTIPSSAQTGLKLNHGFTVAADGETDYTIDFNLRNSIHQRGMGDYMMRPVLRMIDNSDMGSLQGTVTETMLADPGCTGGNFIYVYTGTAVPDDIGSAGANPVATVEVEYDADMGYHYKVFHLPAGEYTATLTCQGDADLPDADDDITFMGTTGVAVQHATVTTHNF